jgi:hypothetical protein
MSKKVYFSLNFRDFERILVMTSFFNPEPKEQTPARRASGKSRQVIPVSLKNETN